MGALARRSDGIARRSQQVAALAASAIGVFWLGWLCFGGYGFPDFPLAADGGVESPGFAAVFVVVPSLICVVGGIRTFNGSAAWYMPIFCVLGFYALVLANKGWPFSLLYAALCVLLVLPTDAWRIRTAQHGEGQRSLTLTAIPAWGFTPLLVIAIGILLVVASALR